MNDPVLEQELIAQHSPTEGDGHGEVPHDAEDAHHGAEDAHGEEPNAFKQLLGTLGDHREIEVGPVHLIDLPVILIDDGLHVFSSLETMEEESAYHWNHETHRVVHEDGHMPALDMSITSLVAFQWLAMLLLLAIFIPIGARYRRIGMKSQKGFANAMEAMVEYVRDNIVVPNVGTGKVGRSLTPVLLTFFFFILTMNLMGLVPGGHSATGSLSGTAGLAVVAFFVIQYAAIRENGFFAWIKHLTGGTPVALWPIMIPVEIMGLFAKPFALCVRLFANMTGGHVVILSLIGLVFVQTMFIPVTIGFSLFINLLELLVAFIQAYIFTILVGVFASMGMAHDHPEEEGHAAAH